jgi:hypothetical protein
MRYEAEGGGVFSGSVESGRIYLPEAIATFGCDEPNIRMEPIQCGSNGAPSTSAEMKVPFNRGKRSIDP